MATNHSVVACVVTFNHRDTIVDCLASLLEQRNSSPTINLEVRVIDNCSSDGTVERIVAKFGSQVELTRNDINLGFAGGHNLGARLFIESNHDFLFLANPDLSLAPGALDRLASTLESDKRAGSACPKLLRADENLQPRLPLTLDAAGMYITPAIRHLDRGSDEIDNDSYNTSQYVFGGSGAALLLRREFVLDSAIRSTDSNLSHQLFDEAFFAYREDADLAWRGQWLGWKCRYVPEAVGYHVRRVVPEKRSELPELLNRYSVRNRFLLQINNLHGLGLQWTMPFALFRNLLVICGVLVKERSSMPALKEVFALLPRALKIRSELIARSRVSSWEISRWFSFTPTVEPALNPARSARDIENIVVIIVNYNSGTHLRNCIRSLSPSSETSGKNRITVVVVDNGSGDESIAMAQTAFAEISEEFRGRFHLELAGENLGFGGGANLARKKYHADAYLILNPDVVATMNDIIALADTLDNYDALALVAPILKNSDGSVQHSFTVRAFPTLGSTIAELLYLHRVAPMNPWTKHYLCAGSQFLFNYLERKVDRDGGPYESLELPLIVDQPAGACFLIRQEDFPGFSEEYWPAWFEDVDLCKRLRNRGRLCATVGTVSVGHVGGYSRNVISSGTFIKAWYPNLKRYWSLHGNCAERVTLGLLLPLALILRGMVSLISAGITWICGRKDVSLAHVDAAKSLLKLAFNGVHR